MLTYFMQQKVRRRLNAVYNKILTPSTRSGQSAVSGTDAIIIQFAASRRAQRDFGGKWLIYDSLDDALRAIHGRGTPTLLPALQQSFDKALNGLRSGWALASAHLSGARFHIFTDHVGDMFSAFVMSLDKKTYQLNVQGIQFQACWISSAEINEGTKTVKQAVRKAQDFEYL